MKGALAFVLISPALIIWAIGCFYFVAYFPEMMQSIVSGDEDTLVFTFLIVGGAIGIMSVINMYLMYIRSSLLFLSNKSIRIFGIIGIGTAAILSFISGAVFTQVIFGLLPLISGWILYKESVATSE